ncbi:MAG: SDR family oxidoreductase [Opitutaceae bacterium]
MSSPGKNPVILITGASQGIGAAIAQVFARELRGSRLALVARNGKKLRAVARVCRAAAPSAGSGLDAVEIGVFPCDVSDEAAVAKLSRVVGEKFGTVDVLINNAGQFFGAPFLKTSVKAFDEMFAANLRSAFLVSRAFAPAMVRRGRGDLFLMGSVASFKALPGMAAYGAAKAGVLALARVMREELKTHGVRVVAVLPGATWSPSWIGSGFEAGRMMPAEDVARAFLDLYRLSRRTVVEEIVLRPQLGDI